MHILSHSYANTIVARPSVGMAGVVPNVKPIDVRRATSTSNAPILPTTHATSSSQITNVQGLDLSSAPMSQVQTTILIIIKYAHTYTPLNIASYAG